ncbi:MAG: methylated-DNA--[protein]-cysteine S-methyltransferase, partial [Betaproteobacteria bacterium]
MTTTHGFALFDTGIGRCGIAWGPRGIIGVQLPMARDAQTRAHLLERYPGVVEAAIPANVRQVIDDIVALLHGDAKDLSSVMLDLENVPPFHRRVYEAARTIVPGATASYGEIAAQLGAPGSARAVGQALGRNPFPIVVPCHRVLAASGKLGGFSANGGIATKLRMLAIESAHVPGTSALFEGDGKFHFDPDAALEHLRASDAALAKLMDAVGPFTMQLKRTPSLFGALAEAIVYQQLNGRAAETIFARVRALFPHAQEGLTARHI